MKLIKSFFICVVILSSVIYSKVFSQVGIGTTAPNASAVLELSNNAKGLLIPRMNESQRTGISFPATGLLVYQTDVNAGFYYNSGTPGIPNWVSLLSSTTSFPWLLNGTNIYNSNAGNVGINTQSPVARFSVGPNSEFQVDNAGNIRKINNVDYSFPLSQGLAGQVLSNNGSGVLNWITSTQATTIILNSSNYLSTTFSDNKIINIQGTITLSANYQLNTEKSFITGGIFDGANSYTIDIGENSVVSGVTFKNTKIDASDIVQFIGCKFDNVTELPFNSSFTGCEITNSIVTTVKSIDFVENSTIRSSSIPRVARITNSDISNSTIGSSTSSVGSMSNNEVDDSFVYLGSSFTGNQCDETKVIIRSSAQVTGNNFEASNLSNFIDVILNTSSIRGINISNNSFTGNTSFPSLSYIQVSGTYTGTRSLTKISNNVAIGGSGVFVLSQYSGTSYLIVNDNDLRNTGGVGVTQGGRIIVRDNLTH